MAQAVNQSALDLALQHHQTGSLREAERLYRQVLAQEPANARAMHYLGLIAHQAGRTDAAVSLIRRSIALNPDSVEAHNNLGNILKECGQLDDAIAAYRQAVAVRPGYAMAHHNLGLVFKEKGQIDEAIAAYRQAIALQRNFPEAYNELGVALKDKGQDYEAIAAYRLAIALRPGYAEAHNNLGSLLETKGLSDEALAAYRRAIALQPDFAAAQRNLANLLKGVVRTDKGVAACRQAVALRPDSAEAHNNLGIALGRDQRVDDAIGAFRRAIAIRPDYDDAYYNLGVALGRNGQFDAAIAAYRQAVALNPSYIQAHNNLGADLVDQGRIEEAVAAYVQAVALRPQDVGAHSNLVLAIQYHPGYGAGAIAEELRRWDRKHAEPLRPSIQPYSNERSPDRPLRIGYFSTDFRDHVVGRSLMPVFERHDRGKFQVICYAQVTQPDVMTNRFHQSADSWRDIVGLSDEQVARQIHDDRIDVLVDLAMHTPPSRLLVFARKPAPVQVCWLAYPGSTGLSTMDYRLSDPFLDPIDGAGQASMDDSVYSERTIRLPDSFWLYGPRASPAPSPAPCQEDGAVTFGCLNKPAKLSTAALESWVRILAALPKSRIIIHALPCDRRSQIEEQFRRGGVEKRRLRFVGNQPWSSYLQTYSEIDIALDPFPWGGGITTCDALWMGVPVVSLSGDTAVGRGGRSILSNLGLPELVACTKDQYVQIAVDLAQDRHRMEDLRRGMRDRMLASPLMDAQRFTCNLETAYRRMWRNWCETAP